jgi:CHAD domain-containing protein
MPNPLVFYQKVRFANILKLMGKLEQAMDADTLHDLRVELKRVRFLKGILSQHKKKKEVDKAYEPFKKLFKKLGKIRGQHVNQYRLSTVLKNVVETTAQKHFQNKRERMEQKLRESLSKNVRSLHEGMFILKTIVAQLPKWNEKVFLRSLKKQVARKINKKTTEKNLHPARHTLKSVIYSAELSNSLASKISSAFNMETLVNLEDAIGDWHDLSILLKGKSGDLLTPKAKKEILKKKKTELKRIQQLIPNLLNRKSLPQQPNVWNSLPS